jgi:hypothetical protein
MSAQETEALDFESHAQAAVAAYLRVQPFYENLADVTARVLQECLKKRKYQSSFRATPRKRPARAGGHPAPAVEARAHIRAQRPVRIPAGRVEQSEDAQALPVREARTLRSVRWISDRRGDTVHSLEDVQVTDLTKLLGKLR